MPTDEAAPLVLSYSDASRVVREHAVRLDTHQVLDEEEVLLGEACGRVLAAPVVADRDQPPFHRATRDGFAGHAAELNRRPVRIVGVVRAGEMWAEKLAPGDAVEIMTGAPVPPGADCVVMIEHTRINSASVQLIGERKVQPGENFVPTGSEAAQGAPLLTAGTRLSPQHIAVAASCGCAVLRVFRKPLVSVQATGDELVEIRETPSPFQIRNSNSYSLAAQITQSGAVPLLLPILRDDRAATEAAIRHARDDSNADLLILSGGVSMGRFDFVEEALKTLGAQFFFTGAKIQPGKPIVFGRLPSKKSKDWIYFFGLPGNPVSTMVTFALFVHPFLNALSGESGGAPRFVLARLGSEVQIKPGVTRFVPATLQDGHLAPEVRPVPWQGSGDLAGNAKANCYLVVPDQLDGSRKDIQAGEIVRVLLIG